MTAATFHSHHDIIRQREHQFEASLQRGDFSPLLIQQVFGAFLLLSVPLLIPHKNNDHSRLLRYGFFSVIVFFTVYTICNVRVIGLANGYGVGLIASWFLVWSATLLIFNDVQQQFKRIEKRVADIYVSDDNSCSELNKPSTPVEKEQNANANGTEPILRRRTNQLSMKETLRPSRHMVYRWQSYPQSFGHRLDWVSDLIFNFRGPEWNWRVRSLPPLPETVTKDLVGQTPASETEDSQVVQNPWLQLQLALRSMLRLYIGLDIIKVLMNRDPYFWGLIESSSTPPFPFNYLAFSQLLVRVYRLLLGVTGVCYALQFAFILNPLFFLGLSLAFPRFSRSITHQPLDEAWLYPEQFGPVSFALDYGLAGCWSQWWHQLFRFGFSETGRFFCDLVLPKDDGDDNPKAKRKNTELRRTFQYLVAFSVSGLVHALGSYTQFAATSPSGPFFFFSLQVPAMLVQRFLSKSILPRILPFKPPQWMKRATNFSFIVIWFYFTGPLIADDFSRGGVWLFEPIPVSPLRALGLGNDGDSWLCWRGPSLQWWEGESWWRSGLRVV